MKNQELKNSLIKSGALLLGLIVIILLFTSSSEGGIMGSIGNLASALYSGVIYLIAMTIGIAFSIIVLVAIFLGVMASQNSQTASLAFNQLMAQLSRKPMPQKQASGRCSHASPEPKKSISETAPGETHQDHVAGLKELISTIQASQDEQNETVKKLTDDFSLTTQDITAVIKTFEELKEELGTNQPTDFSGQIEKLEESQGQLDNKIDKTVSQTAALEKTTSENLTGNKELCSTVDELKKEIATLKDAISELKKKEDEPEIEPDADAEIGKDSEKFRIFSYFPSKNESNEFITAVKDAIAQGMTYAQIDSYLDNTLSAANATIIKEHPTLTKEYIKDSRNNG